MSWFYCLIALPSPPAPIPSGSTPSSARRTILFQSTDQLGERLVERWLNIVSPLKSLENLSNSFNR